MSGAETYSGEPRPIRAKVIGCTQPGFFRVLLGCGHGMLDGCVPCDIPVDSIPPEFRMPNSKFLITMELPAGEVLDARELPKEMDTDTENETT